MNEAPRPSSRLLAVVDRLTQGGDAAPALLVQAEEDWAALALKPSGVLTVLLEIGGPTSWAELAARAAQVARTEAPEVLAGLFPGVMTVILVGSDWSSAVLDGGPPAIPALAREVRWYALGPRGLVAATRRGTTPQMSGTFRALDGLLTKAIARAASARDDELHPATRAAVERAGEAALAAEARFRIAMARKYPPATLGLLAACALVFLLELAWGATTSGATLMRMGAVSRAAIAEGRYETLLAYALLHGGVMHIVMNGLALQALGQMLENVIGWRRFVVVFTLSALGGGIAVALSPTQLAVGASGGIFGLMTALLGLTLRRSGELPALARQRLRNALVATLVFNGAVSLLPGVSLLGHAGGGAVGFVLGISGAITTGVDVPWLPPTEPARAARLRRLYEVLAFLCIAALAASFAIALATGRPWSPRTARGASQTASFPAVYRAPRAP